MMTVTGHLYGLGSNQFGQLGVPNQELKQSYDHPMNLHKLYYSQSAIRITFFKFVTDKHTHNIYNNKEQTIGPDKNTAHEPSPVYQIACGDDFSVALTESGNLYSWGLNDDGRLGVKNIPGRKLFRTSKNEYTYIPQRILFTKDHIDSIHSAGSLSYCRVTGTSDLMSLELSSAQFSHRTYMWGHVPKGLNMKKVTSNL